MKIKTLIISNDEHDDFMITWILMMKIIILKVMRFAFQCRKMQMI
jgi:hypothetical protein